MTTGTGISEADVVALDQIILEMHSQEGVFPWMITVVHDLQQVRDHIAASLPSANLGMDYLAHPIHRNDAVGTVAADLGVWGGTQPYALTMTDSDNSNFKLAGYQVLKNRASINQGMRQVTVQVTDAVSSTFTQIIEIQVLA